MVPGGGINSGDLIDIQSVAWQLQSEFRMEYLQLNISMRPRGASPRSCRCHFSIAINVAILNWLTGQDATVGETKLFFGVRQRK